MTAFPQAGEKWSVGGNSISATGFLGTLNNFPINFKTNNVQRMTLTTAGFLGLGTAAPTVMFECTGNGKINNFKVNAILTVGNKISVNKIFSPAGIIDFEGSILKTTAGILGASLAISGNGTFSSVTPNSFQNPLFAGTGSGLILSDANGSFQKLDFDGNQNTYLRGDGTFGFMTVNEAWKTVNGNIYTTGNFNVGIGIDSPIEKLDVNGNANIRGYLYVQDGVIIGKRIDGQRVNSDTIDVKQLAIKYATTDSLTSLKLATGKIAVSQDINIGERAKIGTNIVIDGLTNNITTPGSITAGNITAGTMNVTNQSISNLNVSGGIKVGNSSIIIGDFTGTGTANNIYTENSDLFIQSNLYNAAGKVCIGTTTPDIHAKLDVAGNIQINNNDLLLRNSHHGLGWYGDATAFGGLDKKFNGINIDGPVLYGWNGGALGLKYTDDTQTEIEKIALSWTQNGDVGIGTNNPQKTLHVKTTHQNTGGSEYMGSMRIENEVLGGSTSVWDFEPYAGNITDYTDNLRFVANGNRSVMTLFEDGKVGIGTTNAIGTLQVGNSSSKVVIGDGFAIPLPDEYWNASYLGFNTGRDDAGNWQFDTDGSHNGGNVMLSTIFGDIRFISIPTTNAGTSSKFLTDQQLLSYTKMVINSNGIGIGTDNPTADLEVIGTIKCTAINMNGSPFNNVWTKSGENIFNSTTGNVGIGTSLPTLAKLHVKDEQYPQVFVIEGGETGTYMSWFYQGRKAWAGFYGGDGNNLNNFELKNETVNGHIILTPTGNGNVGIGTNSPVQTLDITGGLNISSGIIQKGGTKITGIDLGLYSQDGNWMRFVTTNAPINFYSDGGYGTTPNITFASDGKMGIGTNTPTEKLHIKNGSIYIDGEGQGLIVNYNGGKRVGFMKYAYHEAGIWRLGNQDFEIGRTLGSTSLTGSQTNLQTDLYIAGDGKVGIGTTTPSEQLEISNGGNLCLPANLENGRIIFKKEDGFQTAKIFSNCDLNEVFSSLFFSVDHKTFNPKVHFSICTDAWDDEGAIVGINTALPMAAFHVRAADPNLSGILLDKANSSIYNPDFLIRTNAGHSAIEVRADGETTFSVTSGGTLSSNHIYTKYIEVRVDPFDMPDYVFKKDYKLTELNKLDQFIKTNGHLPGVPTAEEVGECGMDLAKMNTTLLQKVEEITLYLIDLNKQIEKLKEENQSLTKVISKFQVK